MVKNKALSFKYLIKVINELKYRILFLINSIIIFRIGSCIPIPGINNIILTTVLKKKHDTIFEMFNIFSRAKFNNASIFTLGIMPYISSSIIIQLLTVIYPYFYFCKKEVKDEPQKIIKYKYYCTLILAIIQAISIITGLLNIPKKQCVVIIPGIYFYLTTIVSLVCGTIFLMWLSEQITERGIGNGISIFLFIGIVADLPNVINNIIKKTIIRNLNLLYLLLIVIKIFFITYFVVFIERGQRRIIINYTNSQQGRYIYLTNNTYLPLKINMVGVIPAIFASSIIIFIKIIISGFKIDIYYKWLQTISLYLQPGQPIYILIYIFAIVFFCCFYTRLILNSRKTADYIKKSGAFIPGIRPGEQTARYLDKVINCLTLINTMYITFICLISEFIRYIMKVSFSLNGTSLLIVVIVIMDFINQVKTLIISTQYKSLFKR